MHETNTKRFKFDAKQLILITYTSSDLLNPFILRLFENESRGV